MSLNDIGFQYSDETYKFEDFSVICQKIYEKLSDELSKKIFINRFLYSLTNDPQFMRNVVLTTDGGVQLYEAITSCEKPYIYGAGRRGQRLQEMFPEISWGGYIDKNKAGELNGLKIIHPDESDKTKSVVITMYSGYEEAAARLMDIGFQGSSLVIAGEYDRISMQNMYFEKTILPKGVDSGSYFIDAGAYDGKDTLRYAEFFGIEKDDIHSYIYEPDTDNNELCRKLFKGCREIIIRKKGLGSKAERKNFDGGHGEGSAISLDGTDTIDVVTIDEELEGKQVSFIKMDVEGAEKEALRGGKKIISSQHPVLAVSIYHKRSDIWELPDLILGLNPGYRFYLRHYTVSYGDTVLYAVDEK